MTAGLQVIQKVIGQNHMTIGLLFGVGYTMLIVVNHVRR
jgi:hypothetical protein